MSRHLRVVKAFCLALTLLLLLSGCANFPRDPQKTLEQALERGVLRVGVVEHPPWVEGPPPGQPGGPEGGLVAAFAGELEVDVEWHWGSAQALLEALRRYELDIVIGGFSQSNPWREHVAFTNPYYTSHVLVGVAPGAPEIGNLEGVTIAVHPHSGLQDMLRQRGASVIVREDLSTAEGPIAAEAWEIEGMGYRATGIHLQKSQHVLALPAGENALLMRLEAFLRRRAREDEIAQQLWESANS